MNRQFLPNKSSTKTKRTSSISVDDDEKTQNKISLERVIIFSDSHGQNLSYKVQQRITSCITDTVLSGVLLCDFEHEFENHIKSLNKCDAAVLIRGCSDLEKRSDGMVLQDYKDRIQASVNTNLILATLPQRHDKPELDGKISYLNAELENLAKSHNHVHVLSIHLLPRHLFTAQGLSFNKKGKEIISKMIIEKLTSIRPLHRAADQPCKATLEETKDQPILVSSSSEAQPNDPMPFKSNSIIVIEEDMENVIEQYRGDPSVAFSHSISSDLHDRRNMSAGVAVSFRRAFGRPLTSEYINSHLTLQNVQNGATVYSLVTKPRFFLKPTKEDYDLAFTQLQQDFHAKGFKSLICSPMGCVRDHILPEHFVKNIVDFQRATRAKVTIVSNNQESRSYLRNGLSHKEFLEKLKLSIAKYSAEDLCTGQSMNMSKLSI